MRIVLMGATGYIGLHIVRELLAAGHEVTAVVRSPEKLGPFARERNLRLAIADLEQPDRVAQALAGQEVCIHAALLWGEPGAELEFRDTAAAARTFESAGQAGVGRCIYISSTAVHRPFSAEMRRRTRPARRMRGLPNDRDRAPARSRRRRPSLRYRFVPQRPAHRVDGQRRPAGTSDRGSGRWPAIFRRQGGC
jgi:nucleoside-diphosphate-sugar epimerase